MRIHTKIVIDIKSGEVLNEEGFDYDGEVAQCSGGSSGGGGDTVTTIRYAEYVEDKHKAFLEAVAGYREDTTDESPFADYTDITTDVAFFGTGYTIASFPSLYDMYGKFMAGLDIDSLHDQMFDDTVNASEVNDLVAAEGGLIDDDIDSNVTPKFQVGMRDINSVLSSSYVVGKALIADSRVKALEKFRSELKYRLIPVATDRWKTHLEWNKTTVMSYAEIMKLYFSAKMDIENFNHVMAAKDSLWPFTVLDYERAALGALQGATKGTSSAESGSAVGGAISGALTGAAMGGMIAGASSGAVAGPVGIGVGAALGLAGSLF